VTLVHSLGSLEARQRLASLTQHGRRLTRSSARRQQDAEDERSALFDRSESKALAYSLQMSALWAQGADATSGRPDAPSQRAGRAAGFEVGARLARHSGPWMRVARATRPLVSATRVLEGRSASDAPSRHSGSYK